MTDEKKTVETEKVWNRSFICVFLTSMFLNSAFWTIVPMVSSYCLELGSDLKTASAVASLMSMAAMFLRPVAGMISSSWMPQTSQDRCTRPSSWQVGSA